MPGSPARPAEPAPSPPASGSAVVVLGGVFGHRHQGVEGVGLDWFVAARAAGGGEQGVGDGVEHGDERGAGAGGAAGGQVPAAFAVAVVPQPPLSMDPPLVASGSGSAAAFTRAHSSRSSASDTRGANSTSRPADGSAAAAAETNAACTGDNSPRRTAWSNSG